MAEPAAVPSQEEVTKTLLDGVDDSDETPPSQGPLEAPLPEPSGPGGLILEEPTPRGAETAKESERVQKLQKELEQEKKRRADSQAAFHRADQVRQMAEAQVQAWEEARRREAWMYEQARQAEPPPIEDPDDLLENSQKLIDYQRRMADWAMARALGYMQPYISQFQSALGRFQQVENLSFSTSFDQAKSAVERMGYTDFDQFRDEILTKFLEYGDEGRTRAMDPKYVKNAYLFLRSERGLPMNTAHSTPPDVLPSRSDRRPAEQREIAQRLGPMASQISRTLGLGNDLRATEEDLERVGLLMGGSR